MKDRIKRVTRLYIGILSILVGIIVCSTVGFAASDVIRPGSNSTKDDRISYRNTDSNVSASFAGCYIIGLQYAQNAGKDSEDGRFTAAYDNTGEYPDTSLALTYHYYKSKKDILRSNGAGLDERTVIILANNFARRLESITTTGKAVLGDESDITVDCRNREKFSNLIFRDKATTSASSARFIPVLSDKIKSNPVLYEQFKAGELDMSALEDAGVVNFDTSYVATANFYNMFVDPGTVNNKIEDYIGPMPDADDEDAIWERRLRYFDVLYLWGLASGSDTSSRQSGGLGIEALNHYLRDFNANGADVYVFPFIQVGITVSENYSNSPAHIWTLPSWYSAISKKSSDNFEGITISPNATSYGVEEQMNGSFPSEYYESFTSSSNLVNQAFEKFASKSGIGKKKEGPKPQTWGGTSVTRITNHIFWSKNQPMTFSGIEPCRFATSMIATDLKGHMSGNIGYTYFAIGSGDKETLEEPEGEFKLVVTSKETNVVSGTNVSATLNVNCKTKKEYRGITKDFFEAQAKKGYEKAKLSIEFSMECLEGTGTSSKLIDTKVKPQKGIISGKKILVRELTWKELEKYLLGKQTIVVVDNQICITADTTNKYMATVTLSWEDGSEVKFYTKNKNKIGDYKAYETVSWFVSEEEVEVGHFYGDTTKISQAIENNFVEIKEGTPGNESFEAMAGVPTTSDLYVGFGAKEFMLNEDLKKATSSGTRKYTYNYTVPNCMEVNAKCTWSCPGHTVTVPSHKIQDEVKDEDGHVIQPEKWCGGASASGSCAGGDITLTATCSCGTTVEKTFKTKGGDNGPEKCEGKDTGAKCWTGSGCVHSQQINECHTHVHTFTGVVEQPIEEFPYMNITDLELWRVHELEYKGNPNLLSNPNHKWDPGTGFYSFYDQEGYDSGNNATTGMSGNGRLMFFVTKSQDENNANIYGDTSYDCPNPETKCLLKTEADTLATEWMNQTKAGENVKAMVVSDYVSLCTTEGYQTAAFHSYYSDQVAVTPNIFAVGSDKKTIAGNPITFSYKPTWAEFWLDNPATAAKWEPDHITRSGYNGNFASPSTKWYNNNVTDPNLPTSKALGLKMIMDLAQAEGYDNHPNSKNEVPKRTDFKTGFQNLRMTVTGLNIIDSTDTATKAWSASDSLQPVFNGEWDTGHCFLRAKQAVKFNDAGGEDFATEGDGMFEQEVGYAPEYSEVNDIVVHNPTSVQNAILIGNDSKYDLRTTESLAEGGDPARNESGCPNDATCQFQHLNCSITPTEHTADCYTKINTVTTHVGGFNSHQHDAACTHVHSVANGCYTGCASTSFSTWSEPAYQWKDCGECGYNPCIRPKKVQVGTNYYWKCTVCGTSGSGSKPSQCPNKTLTCTKSTATNAECTNQLNCHVCTELCKTRDQLVLTCEDPHHIMPGEPWDPTATRNHYDYGDARCWAPCGNDGKHTSNPAVTVPGGQVVPTTDLFINLDREVKIYFPDTGDFAQQPGMLGIATTTNIRGKGYYDNMDTEMWRRGKYVTFPRDVLVRDHSGEFTWQYLGGERIPLHEIPDDSYHSGNDTDKYYWTFYCPLVNSEGVNLKVEFNSIATNAEEVEFYSENEQITNKEREGSKYAARHTAYKYQITDVVGYIGSLTLNDTGDFRFATLFKQEKGDGKWLIENLVPTVNYKLPNKILSDSLDVRQETASEATDWHSTYGRTYAASGGKAHPYVSLPLTPAKNNIKALRDQPMRPGYNLFMDIETVGNYYGVNAAEVSETEVVHSDTDLYYKMQVTPRYWSLNLDTGLYTPVDIYMGLNNEYTPVYLFNDTEYPTEYYQYLNWLEESMRRNYTANERDATLDCADMMAAVTRMRCRTPQTTPDILGTCSRLHLNDINRTFIGSSKTYGMETNPQDRQPEEAYTKNSQRWHFTLGLPSSTVFVEADKPCTDINIKAMRDQNAVIVCAIDVKVRGDVWTLEYDGTSVNFSDGAGFKIFTDENGNGRTYTPPKEADGSYTNDPIIAVYSNKFTSADDLRTEGSH